MAVINLYSDDNLMFISKKKKVFLVSLIISISLCLLTIALAIAFSTYYNQTLVMILSSIIASLLILIFLYSLFRFLDIKKRISQFVFIKEHNGEIVSGKIISQSDLVYTLADGTKAIEIVIEVDKQRRIFYLVSMFDFKFANDKTYSFSIVSDYIKEISYED